MKSIIYSKYNTHRAPEYRLRTSYIKEDGQKYIVKYPIGKAAKNHIASIKKNKSLLATIYNSSIEILDYEEYDEGIKFKFINGKSLASEINCNGEIDDIVKSIVRLWKIVFDYKPECVKDGKVFPANIDSNFSNFIRSGNKIVLIDYEWVDEDPVDINFLKYRTVRYTYLENEGSFKDRISLSDFLKRFGFSDKGIELYGKMEYAFQNTIHGHRHRYYYTPAYQKPTKGFSLKDAFDDPEIARLREELVERDTTIHHKNLEMISMSKNIAELNAEINYLKSRITLVKKSIKNPIYGAYQFSKYVYKKLFIRNRTTHMSKSYKKLYDSVVTPYDKWIEDIESKDLERTNPKELDYNPLISVLVPVYNVADKELTECIDSVVNQTYENWELILVDDKSTLSTVVPCLKSQEERDKRIKVFYSEENGGISEATNRALKEASGDFVGLLDCDDILSVNALYENVKLLNENPDLDLIYSDEDKVDADGKNRQFPNFKPEYSPDTLISIMYICHFSVYRKSIVESVGGFRTETNGSQDHDLAIRVSEKTKNIAHIPKILYHWRMRAESTAGSGQAKPYTIKAGMRAKEDMLKRRGIKGHAEEIPDSGISRVVYDTPGFPLVSIIIPSKDNPGLIKQLLDGLVPITSYRNYEIIIIDNGSSPENEEEYKRHCSFHEANYYRSEFPFNFSKMCNMGAKRAKGEYLLFLNDDIEVIDANWLSRMLGAAMQDHVGAVGAKLYYPKDKLIQHSGVANLPTGPAHVFLGRDDNYPYPYFYNRADYNCIAVTGACLMVKTEKYNEVGGFNEELPVAYNDVDFCMSLIEKGYYNVLRNDAILIHHESVTRGNDIMNDEKFKRLNRERNSLLSKHKDFNGKDPFRSPFLNIFAADENINRFYGMESLPETPENIEEGKEKIYSKGVIAIPNSDSLIVSGHLVFKDSTFGELGVLFEGNKSYYFKAKRDYEKALADVALSTVEDIKYPEFAAFKCVAQSHEMEKGEYKIFAVKDNKKYDMEKIVFIE